KRKFDFLNVFLNKEKTGASWLSVKPGVWLVACLALFFCMGEIPAQSNPNPDASAIKVFRAGASTSVITPKIGTSINGGMRDREVRHINDDTHARALVLDDGETRL